MKKIIIAFVLLLFTSGTFAQKKHTNKRHIKSAFAKYQERYKKK